MPELSNPRGLEQPAVPQPEREWLTYAEASETFIEVAIIRMILKRLAKGA